MPKCIRRDVVNVYIALQIGDKYRVTTPVNWNKGDDVIVHPSVSTEEAKTLFPEHTVHKVRRFLLCGLDSLVNAHRGIFTAVLEDNSSQG